MRLSFPRQDNRFTGHITIRLVFESYGHASRVPRSFVYQRRGGIVNYVYFRGELDVPVTHRRHAVQPRDTGGIALDPRGGVVKLLWHVEYDLSANPDSSDVERMGGIFDNAFARGRVNCEMNYAYGPLGNNGEPQILEYRSASQWPSAYKTHSGVTCLVAFQSADESDNLNEGVMDPRIAANWELGASASNSTTLAMSGSGSARGITVGGSASRTRGTSFNQSASSSWHSNGFRIATMAHPFPHNPDLEGLPRPGLSLRYLERRSTVISTRS